MDPLCFFRHSTSLLDLDLDHALLTCLKKCVTLAEGAMDKYLNGHFTRVTKDLLSSM